MQFELLEHRSLLAADVATSFLNLAAGVADDSYENNDTRTTASNLGTLTASKTINNLVQADAADWYKFTTTATAAAGATVSTIFTHSRGDLDLELYNSSGTRLKVSQGIGDGELISLSGLAKGTYYVRVYGYRGATNPNYSLSINLPSAVQAPTDDQYENNDTQAVAANLGTLSTNTTISNLQLRDSADWFKFTTTATGTTANTATISFQNAQGNLALQLVNANGIVLATSNGSGNTESVSLSGRAAGTYFVRVYSATGATNPNYSLSINAPAQPATPPPVSSGGAFDIQINYTGFTASQRAIFEWAAAEWESIIVGDLPSAIYNGAIVDDLLINATSTDIDGPGGTLGQAGYDRARTSGTRLPYHGSMEFDSADLAEMEADGSLLSVITHEIGHVLGIGTLWQSKGLLVGAGTSNPIFIGPQATAAYNAIFGTNATGVPVENDGGSGTRDSHWRESVFNNEIMTGYINAGSNPLSRITVASLADLGYTVNMAAADNFARPASANLVAANSASSSSNGASRLTAAGDFFAGAIFAALSRSPSQAGLRTDDGTRLTERNLPRQAVFAEVNELIRLWANDHISVTEVAETARPTQTEDVDLIFGTADLGWENS
ncbi:pre-peptidase C-terminal domain-containing protein [Anatilimnocola floriformis]|uniref:pre-peptidase C-terminal domain-containing protein n=1 Tax=Anatilimnocola floriformis TaxID=2948575 RepID=UPI0020C42901|nr:pre-peptidase C-terminal domain-containing protein [Anatilimnocola floriformis]